MKIDSHFIRLIEILHYLSSINRKQIAPPRKLKQLKVLILSYITLYTALFSIPC